MALLETGYRHWHGQVRNVWIRRLVVARHTMRACLRGRVVRFLVIVPWVLSLVTATVYFGIGQMLVPDGLLEPLIGMTDGRFRAVLSGVTAWLALYPDITIHAVANLLLLNLSRLAQTISFLIIAVVIPRLLTRDIANNAIVVYSSRAISRFDYLVGKLAGLVGVLSLSWLGPVLAAWVLGNVVAPDWTFFWHSGSALLHSLLFIIPGMIATGTLALGVSALSAKGRIAVGAWLALWILAAPLVPIAEKTQPWLAYLSFDEDLRRLGFAIFEPYQDFTQARDSLPFFNNVFGKLNVDDIQQWGEFSALGPSIAVMAAMTFAIIILLRRVRPL